MDVSGTLEQCPLKQMADLINGSLDQRYFGSIVFGSMVLTTNCSLYQS